MNVAVGYPRTVADCLLDQHHGAMGYHHVNRSYITHDLAIENRKYFSASGCLTTRLA